MSKLLHNVRAYTFWLLLKMTQGLRCGLPMSNSTPNLVKISETTAEIWWFSFFFQDGGRPTCWIFIQVKNGRYGTLQTVHIYHHAKFGENSSNGSRVIAIFHYSKWRPAAILDSVLPQKYVADCPCQVRVHFTPDWFRCFRTETIIDFYLAAVLRGNLVQLTCV